MYGLICVYCLSRQVKLNTNGKKRLQEVIGGSEGSTVAYTTSELGAALSVTGAIVDKVRTD